MAGSQPAPEYISKGGGAASMARGARSEVSHKPAIRVLALASVMSAGIPQSARTQTAVLPGTVAAIDIPGNIQVEDLPPAATPVNALTVSLY